MTWLVYTVIWLVCSVVMVAGFPTLMALFTDKPPIDDPERLGLIGLIWPVPLCILLFVGLLRLIGYLGRSIPLIIATCGGWVTKQMKGPDQNERSL